MTNWKLNVILKKSFSQWASVLRVKPRYGYPGAKASCYNAKNKEEDTMKKILVVMLALVLALSCISAMAAEIKDK